MTRLSTLLAVNNFCSVSVTEYCLTNLFPEVALRDLLRIPYIYGIRYAYYPGLADTRTGAEYLAEIETRNQNS